jgi:acetolactate synthase-1/2/3 large subunit
MERGGDLPAVRRIPYFPKRAVKLLSSYQTLVLSGASEPVAFFGYKDQPSRLLSKEQAVFRLAVENISLPQALDMLADSLQASAAKPSAAVTVRDQKPSGLPTGALDTQKVCSILAGQQPENAIVVDESISSGGAYFALAGNAPPHSLLTLTGGAIGFGLPCATGAAIACPDRPVIDLQADGSAMYTIQSLWMQAREGLNVTTLIFSNRRYKILEIETARSGLGSAGKNAQALFDLQNPRMDWVQISHGMGVPAVQVDTCEMLVHEFRQAIDEAGPHLIEMLI